MEDVGMRGEEGAEELGEPVEREEGCDLDKDEGGCRLRG